MLTKSDDAGVPPSLVHDAYRVGFLGPRTKDAKVSIARPGRFNIREHGLKHGGSARSLGHSVTVSAATLALARNVLISARPCTQRHVRTFRASGEPAATT